MPIAAVTPERASPERISPEGTSRAKDRVLADLRARIATLEGFDAPARKRVIALGDAGLDGALPWGGLPLGCLHEICGRRGEGAASGFLIAVLAALRRATATSGDSRRGRDAALRVPVLWCAETSRPYGPGLTDLGLDPRDILLVRTRRARETLWAMEEGLQSGVLAAVVGDIQHVSLTAARRLQLAAEAGGTAGFLLIAPSGKASARVEPTSAVTRWEISPAPSAPGPGSSTSTPPWLGPARWRVALTRCRGGGEGAWLVDYREAVSTGGEGDETHRLVVVPAPCDGPFSPRRHETPQDGRARRLRAAGERVG